MGSSPPVRRWREMSDAFYADLAALPSLAHGGPWFGLEDALTPNLASSAEFDPRLFRDVLGRFATGVTVITANTEAGPVAMAANSFTSVSISPPLVLFCPAKSSSTWRKMRADGRFCINVLAGHHEALSRQFAGPEADRFAGVAGIDGECGPLLADAVAWIDCRVRAEHDGGDHTIVVADVLSLRAAQHADAEPLVFHRGRYGTFRPSSVQ